MEWTPDAEEAIKKVPQIKDTGISGAQRPGTSETTAILEIISACIALYKSKSKRGERFGQVMSPADIEEPAKRFSDRML